MFKKTLIKSDENKVTVIVWKSKLTTSDQRHKRIGHVALMTYGEENIYVSLWPPPGGVNFWNHFGVQPSAVQRTFKMDLDIEGDDCITSDFYSLDVKKIISTYRRFENCGFRYSLLGSSKFKHPETHNCVSLIAFLLDVGGINKLASSENIAKVVGKFVLEVLGTLLGVTGISMAGLALTPANSFFRSYQIFHSDDQRHPHYVEISNRVTAGLGFGLGLGLTMAGIGIGSYAGIITNKFISVPTFTITAMFAIKKIIGTQSKVEQRALLSASVKMIMVEAMTMTLDKYLQSKPENFSIPSMSLKILDAIKNNAAKEVFLGSLIAGIVAFISSNSIISTFKLLDQLIITPNDMAKIMNCAKQCEQAAFDLMAEPVHELQMNMLD